MMGTTLRLVISAMWLLVVAVMPVAPTSAAASMALQQDDAGTAEQPQQRALFSDGFDATGDMSLWSGETMLTVLPQAGYQASYGAHGVSAGMPVFAETRLREPVNDAYARIRFTIAEQGNNPVVLLQLRSVAGRSILVLTVNADGTLGYTLDEGRLAYTSTQRIEPGTWYGVQVHLAIAGNNSAADVWLDDVSVPDLSHRFGLEDKTAGRIEIGDNTAGRSWDVSFDDVIVDTAKIAATQETDPVNGTLTVRTTPRIPGLQFVLDGKTFVTDSDGIARIDVERWSADLQQRIQVPKTELGPAYKGAVASFWSWNGWLNGRDHDVNAFFDLSYPLQLSFIDQTDDPVDLARIDSVTLQNNLGTVVTLTGDQLKTPQLLPASRVVPSRQGRKSGPFTYSVIEVNVRGSNVVNRGQQQFQLTGDSPPALVKLLLFSATITAKDALFGKRAGDTIELEYPDGGVEQFTFDSNHSVVIPLLARGDYKVSVIGAGYSPPRPITLSRDQVVDLEVVTMLDVGVIGGLIGSFAIGLLIAGRPGIVTFPFRMFRRRRPRRPMQEARG